MYAVIRDFTPYYTSDHHYSVKLYNTLHAACKAAGVNKEELNFECIPFTKDYYYVTPRVENPDGHSWVSIIAPVQEPSDTEVQLSMFEDRS